MKRCLLFAMMATMTVSANAAERFLVNFELSQGENKIEWGKAFVSGKAHTWSKGLQRSYLKVSCQQQDSGKVQKLYSTVDYFAGLRVTHQLVGDSLEVNVVRNIVQPRYVEIRALTRNECKDLSPIVTTTTQSYSFAAKDGSRESRPFGEDKAFSISVQAVGGTR